MSAKHIEDLPTTTLDGTEKIHVVDGGNSRQTTVQAIVNLALGGGATAELIRDTIGTALIQAAGVTIVVNDAGDTITISADTEAIQDVIGALIAAGTGITVTYNDAGNVETISIDQTALKPTEYLEIALSDETTALTTGDGKASWFFGYDFTITEAYIGLGAAQSSSGVVTVDINKNGSTILSTKATIGASQNTSLSGSGSVAAVISTATSTKGDKFTADLDAAGTGAKGLKLIIGGHRT